VKDYREAMSRFRDTMRREGDRSEIPRLTTILDRERSAKGGWFRWAVAAGVALVLAAIPVYESARQRQREAAQATADELLLEQVNAGLSRSASRAMSPLMGWKD
jgi:hypothetical protein